MDRNRIKSENVFMRCINIKLWYCLVGLWRNCQSFNLPGLNDG